MARDWNNLKLDWRQPLSVLRPVAGRSGTVALISDGIGQAGRYSYIAIDPLEVLRIEPEDRVAPLERLKAFRDRARCDGRDQWIFGLAAYELGHALEGLELGRDLRWPLLWAGRYETVLRFDHQDRQVQFQGYLPSWLMAQFEAEESACEDPGSGSLLRGDVRAGPKDAYEKAVHETVDRIGNGEIFQANLARQWLGELRQGIWPVDVLNRLVASSPAPYAAYLMLNDQALVSNSPEQFLRVQDRLAVTRPVKGTRARAADFSTDERLRFGLRNSAKDQAENLMIVDLMRNDLARHCRAGSVKVPDLFAIESFSNVHHLVSTVTGELEAGSDALDLFAASLPPGSVTGAPKIQAMKVISEYEPPRGPYCGSLFRLSPQDDLDSSVLIRTIALSRKAGAWCWEARAGAGIVADSDPIQERIETETKISAILKAMTGKAGHDRT